MVSFSSRAPRSRSARGERFAPGRLAALTLLAAACSPETPSSPDAPARRKGPFNLVVIVLDTARADRVVDPDGKVLFENLAGLASDGVVFPHCFSHASMTLPAHVSLFTSRFPYETGVLTNESAVPEDLPNLTRTLHQKGYLTAGFSSIGALRPDNLLREFDHSTRGDWGLTFAENAAPLAIECLDSLGARRPAFLFAHYSDPHFPYRSHDGEETEVEILLDGALQGARDASMAEFWEQNVVLAPGLHRIEARSDQKFQVRDFAARVGSTFAEAFYEEGELWKPAQRVVIRFDNPRNRAVEHHLGLYLVDVAPPQEQIQRYALEIEHADHYIGELLDELKARDLYDSSLIVFTGDHGEGLGDHEFWVHAENIYDEQLRVPLIVKPPAGFPLEGLQRQADRLVRHVDVTATILDILGLEPYPGQKGVSLVEDGERLLVAQTHKPISTRDLLALRDERFKLIFDAGADRFEMYDIAEDPGESRDVFAERGSERAQWTGLLRWMAGEALDKPQAEIDEGLRAQLNNLGYGESTLPEDR